MSIVNHIRCWLFAGVHNGWKLMRQPYKAPKPSAQIISLDSHRRDQLLK